MTLQQRYALLFAARQQTSPTSVRAIAKSTQLSKSSVWRLQSTIQRRDQHPESPLWETPAGSQWLRLLVLTTIFVFGLLCGVGCERLSQFFKLLRLQRHLAVSPSALRAIRSRMEDKIIEFSQLQLSQLPQSSHQIDICAAADETFFDQVVLVMMDLASGYILVEEKTSDRSHPTWQATAQAALSRLGLNVKYFVSDRLWRCAKRNRALALIKLALSDVGCASIPDLFHALRGLCRGIGWELTQKFNNVSKIRRFALQHPPPPTLMAELDTLYSDRVLALEAYRHTLHTISSALHPFLELRPTSSATVAELLQTNLRTLTALKHDQQLVDTHNSLTAFAALIPELASVVDIWWDWTDTCLQSLTTDAATIAWVKQQLLPATYWQQQLKRTQTLALKPTYTALSQSATAAVLSHPFTASIPSDALHTWSHWAQWMVARFHRASSMIEGRHSYLSQINHNRRGLSTHRLKVLTVIHNFYLQRDDCSTAAQRLFGCTFPNLFDWLLSQLGDLPLPRLSSVPT